MIDKTLLFLKDLFTDVELKFIKKYTLKGIIIVIIISFLASLSNIIDVYVKDGYTGLMSLNTFRSEKVDESILQSINKLAQNDQNNKDNTITNDLIEDINISELGIIKGELPLELYFPDMELRANIQAPNEAKVSILDEALKKGPVYYPGSGSPGDGNVLLFGHSSSWTVVKNKNYKIFNKIKDAQKGQFIYIKTYSGTHIYKVLDVKKVSKYNTWVGFSQEKPTLTLATCDSFGKRSDRWVLEAEYYKFEKF